MGKVFISYSTKNQKVANELCAYLEQAGIACWMAPRDIPSASNYAGEITRAIKSADDFLLVYSKDSCKSVHVKNEINLAINNAKSILPYCIDNSPYDDDLEYYLSSRQKIVSFGDQKKDFVLIEHALAAHHPERTVEQQPAAVLPESGNKRNRIIIPIVCAALLIAALVAFLLLRNRPEPPVSPDNTEKVDSTTVAKDSSHVQISQPKPDSTQKQSQSQTQTQTPDQTQKPKPNQTQSQGTSKDPNADTFTGPIRNGYPNGYGIYTFKQRRRIDMHDDQQRYAEKGDYIEGTWDNGHLNFGDWYGANGVKKAFIELGDNPDSQADHVFAKCVKP
ncbi:MAG: toll/interleukin-1 receptor domain-containing protein [Bacteroidales bacterium]|nr:toll/interleukin-1 receptor domain-containing protein [Bacteroidales bacterium]